MLFIQEMLLSPKRKYVMDKVKKPLMKAITILAKRYPEPTRENTKAPNTKRLFDIRDKFFEYEDNKGRKPLFEAIWKIFIAEYEHDPYYRYRIDWALEEIAKSGWEPRPAGRPYGCWREPEAPLLKKIFAQPKVSQDIRNLLREDMESRCAKEKI